MLSIYSYKETYEMYNKANVGKSFLILGENKKFLTYQFYHSYSEVLCAAKLNTLWFIDKGDGLATDYNKLWKAHIVGKEYKNKYYYSNSNREEFVSQIQKTYPECVEWLLFNIDWIS